MANPRATAVTDPCTSWTPAGRSRTVADRSIRPRIRRRIGFARPDEGNDIGYLLLHSTESTYSSTINAFGDPDHGTSTHYVIRSADGEITQRVRTDDVAFHAGNWTFNSRAIGIEHEGFVADGATWFTEEMYRSSARLVRYLAERYDIPLDRRHILGSDEIQRGTPDRVAGAHHDPATYSNWPYFMAILGAGDERSATEANSGIVTITPPFEGNLHPDGGPGTTQICDWSIPVYGVAYPEPEAFPSTIPVQEIRPLQYRIAAGRRYTVTDVLPGQYYYSRFDGADVPDNHTLVLGDRRYALINFNCRHAYVDLNDVRFVNPEG